MVSPIIVSTIGIIFTFVVFVCRIMVLITYCMLCIIHFSKDNVFWSLWRWWIQIKHLITVRTVRCFKYSCSQTYPSVDISMTNVCIVLFGFTNVTRTKIHCLLRSGWYTVMCIRNKIGKHIWEILDQRSVHCVTNYVFIAKKTYPSVDISMTNVCIRSICALFHRVMLHSTGWHNDIQ
jgi:hypothetical protein